MTQSPQPAASPSILPSRSKFQRIAGPSIPDRLKTYARKATLKLGEYWLLTFVVSVSLLVWFAGFAESTAGQLHWEYWWSVLTGNYQPANDTVRKSFVGWEYGASLVLALMINITPLVGVMLFLPRYMKMLMQLQEQPVKVHALLDMVDGLAKSELLTEFGQSEETMKKIKSAFLRVKARRPDYITEVFGEKTGDFSRILNKEI